MDPMGYRYWVYGYWWIWFIIAVRILSTQEPLSTQEAPWNTVNTYPDAPCMDYLPTLGEKWPQSKGNVGKYSLHGASGISSFWKITTYTITFKEFDPSKKNAGWICKISLSQIFPKRQKKNILWKHHLVIGFCFGGVVILLIFSNPWKSKTIKRIVPLNCWL